MTDQEKYDDKVERKRKMKRYFINQVATTDMDWEDAIGILVDEVIDLKVKYIEEKADGPA